MGAESAVDPRLERRLTAPAAASEAWRDRHRLLLATTDPDREPSASLVIGVEMSLPAAPVAGHRTSGVLLRTAVIGPGRPLVISDADGVVPARSWELRSSGLWAELVCEQPFDHWSYGLEAFALAVDDPVELLGRARGERVPLGWELDFEATAPAEWVEVQAPLTTTGTGGPPAEGPDAAGVGDGGSAGDDLDGYRQVGRCSGLVMIGRRRLTVDGAAVRFHQWGSGPLGADPSLGADPVVDRGERIPHGSSVALPGPTDTWWLRATAGGAWTVTT